MDSYLLYRTFALTGRNTPHHPTQGDAPKVACRWAMDSLPLWGASTPHGLLTTLSSTRRRSQSRLPLGYGLVAPSGRFHSAWTPHYSLLTTN